MKTVRIVLWAIVVLAFIGAAYMFSQNLGDGEKDSALKLGGPFNLVTHRGEPITEAALKGRAHAVFFRLHPLPRCVSGYIARFDRVAE